MIANKIYSTTASIFFTAAVLTANSMPMVQDHNYQNIINKGVRYMCSDRFQVDTVNLNATDTPKIDLYKTKNVTKQDALSLFGEMRYATEEEAKSYEEDLRRISKPTGKRLVF